MRHSRIELTMNLYTDAVLLDMARAVEALPSFGGKLLGRDSEPTWPLMGDLASLGQAARPGGEGSWSREGDFIRYPRVVRESNRPRGQAEGYALSKWTWPCVGKPVPLGPRIVRVEHELTRSRDPRAA